MAVHDRIRKLTYDDYAQIPADGQRHEIIDGEHYVSAAPFISHQRVVAKVFRALDGFVFRQALGEVFLSPSDVVLSWNDVVQPDLFFISKARAEVVTDKNVQGAPDLVIEIISESTRRLDETVKLNLYDRFGVSEYWIFDPFRKTARVHRQTLQGLRLIEELTLGDGDVLTTSLLPGLEIPLSEIFE